MEIGPERQQGWTLLHGFYDVLSSMHVTVPAGVACMIFPRSTLVRNGLFVSTGLYDQGFSGTIGGTLHIRNSLTRIAKGTRIGQIVFVTAQDSKLLYAGGYNHEAGKHWAESSIKATAKPQVFNIEPAQRQPQVDSQVDPQVDPLVGGSAQSTLAKELQTTSTWNSDQQGPPAGTKSFF